MTLHPCARCKQEFYGQENIPEGTLVGGRIWSEHCQRSVPIRAFLCDMHIDALDRGWRFIKPKPPKERKIDTRRRMTEKQLIGLFLLTNYATGMTITPPHADAIRVAQVRLHRQIKASAKAGSSTSKDKAASARENGAKGGRPRKSSP